MNRAQKRTWLSLVISLAGISLGAIAILGKANSDQRPTFSLLGLALTIPLISMVILSWRIPGKEYDERDRKIENKALIFGVFGVFAFLGGICVLLCFTDPMGFVEVRRILLLVYLASFVWFLTSSVAALIQYNWRVKGEQS